MTPNVFLPYQARWVADQSQLKVGEKGRRTGITWAEAADDVLVAATAGRAGMDVMYIGYNQEMTREYIETAAEWARHFQRAACEFEEFLYDDSDGDDKRSILAFRIRFASGYEIVALSSSPRNLRGKQGRVVIDEAAFHDNLKELLKAALALLMWGGQVVVISTHNGVDNEFNQLIEKMKAGKQPGSHHKISFDDALAEGLYRRICYIRGMEWSEAGEKKWRQDIIDIYGDGAPEELFCIPTKSGGAYLSVGLIEQCMYPAPVIRLEKPESFTWQPENIRHLEIETWCKETLQPKMSALPQQLHAFGEDFGRVSDLTVLAPLTIEQNLTRRVPFTVELLRIPYEQQKQVVLWMLDRLPRFVKGAFDSTGNGAYLAEVTAQKFGEKMIETVTLNNKAYGEIMPKFKAALEDRTMFIPKDSDIRDDLRAIQVIDGIPKIPSAKTGTQKKRHADAAIALALAHYASTLDYQNYDYKAATPAAIAQQFGSSGRRVSTTAGFGARKGIW